MIEIIFDISAVLLILAATYAMYCYLFRREKDSRENKIFFKPEYDKKLMILTLVTLVLAIGSYFYGTLLMEVAFLRGIVNSMVLIWLIILGYIDLKEKIIPNHMILVGLAFWLLISVLQIVLAGTAWYRLLIYSLSGGLICGGVLMVIALVMKSALGMGDVKMFTVIGLIYGLANTYSILLFSIIIMAILSIILLVMKRVTKKTAIPMAPFVAIGFFINVLFGI